MCFFAVPPEGQNEFDVKQGFSRKVAIYFQGITFFLQGNYCCMYDQIEKFMTFQL